MNKKLSLLIPGFLLFVCVLGSVGQEHRTDFYWRGALYFDWFGAKYENSPFFHQLSTRLRLEMVNRRGDGWTFLLDTRDRLRLSGKSGNRIILYDARILFDKQRSPLFLSLGQMNLYDTAGIGQLLGGIVGVKIGRDFLLGGYGGLESSIYIDRVENDYQKYGVFARYQGDFGKRFSLSYNHIRFSGATERQYMYAGTMFPFVKTFTLYGNLEYEIASNVKSEDRLSRIFLNVRWDPARTVDITAFYSSGRGLDYHRYILEKSQDPTLNDTELERFYYSSQYGLRLSVKPIQNTRLHVSRIESEQNDMDIRNHTWRLGGSVGNMLQSGITLYGSYAWNRGEMSESDSYYVALSKDFGRVSWHGSFSNTFNGVRYDHRSETPEVIRLNDYKTFATQFFVPITRLLAASLEYEYFLQEESNQHLFFVRLILRN
ncbi:MAG: hypothetical protein PVH84_07875 [Candidatus Aminicenantes bacterium]